MFDSVCVYIHTKFVTTNIGTKDRKAAYNMSNTHAYVHKENTPRFRTGHVVFILQHFVCVHELSQLRHSSIAQQIIAVCRALVLSFAFGPFH